MGFWSRSGLGPVSCWSSHRARGVCVCAVVKLRHTLRCPAAARVAGASAGARDRSQHFIPRSVLQPAAETLLLLQSSAIFWYFLQKKFTNRILFFLTLCVMSLFKILLGVFNLFRNSKRSSSCSVCKARCVYFILFIRLDHVGMVQSIVNTANGRSWERTDPRPRLHPQGPAAAWTWFGSAGTPPDPPSPNETSQDAGTFTGG